MPFTDGTTGYFGDLPYFGPVEVLSLYSFLHSSRIHKLQEKNDIEKKQRKLSCFPAFHSCSSAASIFHPDGSDYVTVIYGASRRNENGDSWREVQLNINGIDQIWTETIRYALGGHRSYLFSIMLAGMSSMIHSFSSMSWIDNERLNSIEIGLHVLNTANGKVFGDTIHIYLENSLRLCVSDVHNGEVTAEYDRILESATVVDAASSSEWREEIRSYVVDSFEELCDLNDDDDDDHSEFYFKAPIVLLVLPDGKEESMMQSKVLDSYTSVPTRIIRFYNLQENLSILNESTTKVDGILHKLRIKRVIHCGYVEYGECLREEIVSMMSLIPSKTLQGLQLIAIVPQEPIFFEHKEEDSSPELTIDEVELADGVLLLFRRFLVKYSPETHQPRVRIPESLFISGPACRKHQIVIKYLEMGGCVRLLAGCEDEVELTAVGRFLSSAFRYTKGYGYKKRFTVLDAKIVLWGFILRQSRHLTLRLIMRNHLFHSWVPSWLESFCESHRITLEQHTELDNDSLVLHLSSYGLKWNSPNMTKNRLHYLLSLPRGKRTMVQNHYIHPPSTVCRGWYPTETLPGESPSVQTYSYPVSSVFCELAGSLLSSAEEKSIQCPLEISYPLLVMRATLHISFHNNGVLLEAASDGADAKPMPLPLDVLRLRVVTSILSLEAPSNAGVWLDGFMQGNPLLPSDSSLLDFMRYKGSGGSGLTYGDNASIAAGKKRKRDASNNDAKGDEAAVAAAFKGKKPRNQMENSAITEFVALAKSIGRVQAEKSLRGKEGFGFLDPHHNLHAYYFAYFTHSLDPTPYYFTYPTLQRGRDEKYASVLEPSPPRIELLYHQRQKSRHTSACVFFFCRVVMMDDFTTSHPPVFCLLMVRMMNCIRLGALLMGLLACSFVAFQERQTSLAAELRAVSRSWRAASPTRIPLPHPNTVAEEGGRDGREQQKLRLHMTCTAAAGGGGGCYTTLHLLLDADEDSFLLSTQNKKKRTECFEGLLLPYRLRGGGLLLRAPSLPHNTTEAEARKPPISIYFDATHQTLTLFLEGVGGTEETPCGADGKMRISMIPDESLTLWQYLRQHGKYFTALVALLSLAVVGRGWVTEAGAMRTLRAAAETASSDAKKNQAEVCQPFEITTNNQLVQVLYKQIIMVMIIILILILNKPPRKLQQEQQCALLTLFLMSIDSSLSLSFSLTSSLHSF
eukprot:gene1493-880_t